MALDKLLYIYTCEP